MNSLQALAEVELEATKAKLARLEADDNKNDDIRFKRDHLKGVVYHTHLYRHSLIITPLMSRDQCAC
jgi:hypothetical protein